MIGVALVAWLAAVPVVSGGLVAEVGPTDSGAAAMKAAGGEVVQRTARVVLWRVPDAAAVLADPRFTAVFHDGPKLRVPAGGVVVWLAGSTNVAAWASERGVVVEKVLREGVLLLQSAPGTASLTLAEALKKDSRVKSATPNWWLRAAKK